MEKSRENLHVLVSTVYEICKNPTGMGESNKIFRNRNEKPLVAEENVIMSIVGVKKVGDEIELMFGLQDENHNLSQHEEGIGNLKPEYSASSEVAIDKTENRNSRSNFLYDISETDQVQIKGNVEGVQVGENVDVKISPKQTVFSEEDDIIPLEIKCNEVESEINFKELFCRPRMGVTTQVTTNLNKILLSKFRIMMNRICPYFCTMVNMMVIVIFEQ